MKSHYTIDADRGIIFKKHKGEITVKDEIDLLNTIISDPLFRKGMHAICDFTDATVVWELADLDQFRAYVNRSHSAWGNCKWAIIFPPGKDTSAARMFVALNDAFTQSISAKLFQSAADAIAWVLEPVPAKP